MEKEQKVVLFPTSLERKHSASALDLLGNMQPADLDISLFSKTISSRTGGEVVVCINGMEAQPDEITTLRAKHIQKIEYVRTPHGKYTGKAAVINFITRTLEYGGNVYVSAIQGFTYWHGDYVAHTDFTRKRLTLALTLASDWHSDHSYTEGFDTFMFANGSKLQRTYEMLWSHRKGHGEMARIKLSAAGEKYRFSSYINLVHQAVPSHETLDTIQYDGRFAMRARREIRSSARSLAPSVQVNYTRWLPHNQSLDADGSLVLGKNRHGSDYQESAQGTIRTEAREKNLIANGKLQYAIGLKGNIQLSLSVAHTHKDYKDLYGGTSAGEQRLVTDESVGVAQIAQSGQNYFFYLSGGVSNTAVRLNTMGYNYLNPIMYYGANYLISQRHALSLNGIYTHTLFDPSSKNDMLIPISFFEIRQGNPDIKPLQALSNTLAYNGQFGRSKISLSYMNSLYFNNIVSIYTADGTQIYRTNANDGRVIGNMFSATYAYSAFENRLRLSGTLIDEYNILMGKTYSTARNILRFQGKVTLLIGGWQFHLAAQTPYTTLDIKAPCLRERPATYELQIQ